MTLELDGKVAYLRTPGVLGDHVDCIETHMSWVFLTADRVYKLKKPARLPHLDHATLARRHHSCVQELTLGRRLARDVYLELAPLRATSEGLAVGGPFGEIIDWLVVMRRLPAERMLPRMIAEGTATEAHATAVGDVLATFYGQARVAPWDGATYRCRLRGDLLAFVAELVELDAPRPRIEAILDFQLATLDRHAHELDARIAQGRVVDAHGDLRPEHVCIEPPPAVPAVIDPLEFDDELRLLDAASELAFFALECERLEAAWFGTRVIARYAERTGDRVPAPLAALYRNHHVLVRAVLALRHLVDTPARDHPRWRAKANAYLGRAVVRDAGVAPELHRSWA